MASPFGANSNEIPTYVLNPMPISVAPPRSPVHPSIQPLVQRFIDHFESLKRKTNRNRKRKGNERPDFLPDGWEIKVFTRKTGNAAGTEYKNYIELGTKKAFRSLKDVQRHLGLNEIPKKTKIANNVNGGEETEYGGSVSMNAKQEKNIQI